MLKGEYKYHCEVPIYCFERYLILLWNDDVFCDDFKIGKTAECFYDAWCADKTGKISDIPIEEFIINSLKNLGFEFDYIYVDADTGNE